MAEEKAVPQEIQLAVSRRSSLQPTTPARVIPAPGTTFDLSPTGAVLVSPAPGTRFIPTTPGTPLPPPPPDPPVITPGNQNPTRPGTPLEPDRPLGPPLSLGGTVRALADDIRSLSTDRATAARALGYLDTIAAALNTQDAPEVYRPLVERYFIIDRDESILREKLEESMAEGRQRARDTRRDVVVAQAVLILTESREVTEAWL